MNFGMRGLVFYICSSSRNGFAKRTAKIGHIVVSKWKQLNYTSSLEPRCNLEINVRSSVDSEALQSVCLASTSTMIKLIFPRLPTLFRRKRGGGF